MQMGLCRAELENIGYEKIPLCWGLGPGMSILRSGPEDPATLGLF